MALLLMVLLAAIADAGDRRDHVLLRRVLGPELAGRLAEAEDEDPVGDREDVRQVVTDDDNAEVALAQAADQLQDLFGLRHPESGRRLVEEHDFRLAQERAGDGDLLALAAGEGADLRAQARDRHREVREQIGGLVLHLHLVELAGDRPRPGRYLLPAEKEVGDDVEVVAEREVLVDGRDPQFGRVLRPVDPHLPPLEAHRAAVGGIDAGDRLDQRRLAGPVVADEAHDLAGADGEVDPVQRLDRAEPLAYALQLEERSAVSGHFSPRFPLLCRRPRRGRCRVRRV